MTAGVAVAAALLVVALTIHRSAQPSPSAAGSLPLTSPSPTPSPEPVTAAASPPSATASPPIASTAQPTARVTTPSSPTPRPVVVISASTGSPSLRDVPLGAIIEVDKDAGTSTVETSNPGVLAPTGTQTTTHAMFIAVARGQARLSWDEACLPPSPGMVQCDHVAAEFVDILVT